MRISSSVDVGFALDSSVEDHGACPSCCVCVCVCRFVDVKSERLEKYI